MSAGQPGALVADIRRLVGLMTPCDDLESEHLTWTRDWSGSTDDIFRRSTRPTLPAAHLVSYFLLVQPSSRQVLLGSCPRSVRGRSCSRSPTPSR